MNDETETQRHELALQSTGGSNMLLDRPQFEQGYKIARLFSQSQLVPQHLQNKPEDCFIALHMAHRLGEDPLMVMQNIVIVHGTAGWKAQWLIGRANRSGVFRGRIKFAPQGSGKDLSVTALATMADTGEEVSASASMKMAELEGWTKNPKYQSMPEQMLSYRAASFLIRLYCPEATLGYQTTEEVEDMAAAGQIKDVTPGRHTPTRGAEEALRGLPASGTGPAKNVDGGQQGGTGDEQQGSGEEPPRDADGLPWDDRIHSSSKVINDGDGRWRRRRGITDEQFNRVAEELRSIQQSDDDIPSGSGGSSEPTGAGESDDPGQTGEGSAPGDDEGTQQPPPGVDPETGETTAPSGDDLLGGQSGGEAPEDPPAGDSGDGGPPDSEIVTRIQRYLPTARKAGDLEMLADLEDEAREIRNDDWRQHMNEQLSSARQAIEAGAS